MIHSWITDLFGKPGLKTVESDPRQPFGLSLPGGPATPLSPDAKKTETPRSPSFMNLHQINQFYPGKSRVNVNPTHYIVSVDISQESRVPDHRTKQRSHSPACTHHTLDCHYIPGRIDRDRQDRCWDHPHTGPHSKTCSKTVDGSEYMVILKKLKGPHPINGIEECV